MAESGDTILFFSDGVEDQLNAKEEDYSRTRVVRMLKKHGAECAGRVREGDLFADLDTYREGTPITDDQSVVVMRVC